jgi:hypothetical protein
MILHKLSDDSIKSFLRVDSITHHSIPRAEMVQDFLQAPKKPELRARFTSLVWGGHISDDAGKEPIQTVSVFFFSRLPPRQKELLYSCPHVK